MFKSHLDLIGNYEPISRKGRFFCHYLKSLKGSEDIRAQEKQSTFAHKYATTQNLYTDSMFAIERINSPGYHYNPVSRETYAVKPRQLNTSDYK